MQDRSSQRCNTTTLGRPPARRWVRALLLTAGIALALSTSIASYAQTTPPLERVHAASEGVTRPYSHPAIDEAGALKGAALLSALRQGGLNLFMRHTQAGIGTALWRARQLPRMLSRRWSGQRQRRRVCLFWGDSRGPQSPCQRTPGNAKRRIRDGVLV